MIFKNITKAQFTKWLYEQHYVGSVGEKCVKIGVWLDANNTEDELVIATGKDKTAVKALKQKCKDDKKKYDDFMGVKS